MKANWDYYRAKWFLGAVRRRIAHTYFKKYAGRDFLTAEAGNDLIYEAIMRGDPFVAGPAVLRTTVSETHMAPHR